MKIDTFEIERWMDLYENQCKYNLAETCVESLTIKELIELTGRQDIYNDLLTMKLTYGAINGSDHLRTNVATLYQRMDKNNILITHGAIGANSLIYATLIEKGDHVITVVPTYQQHQSIPKSYGANVDLLEMREENDFLPDLNELQDMITPNTKLIAINNPNNPTGALLDREVLLKFIEIAKIYDTYILCDEVYRGLNGEGNGFTASIADLYDKGISTGSMSKAYSLAGLRLGWIATSSIDLLNAVITHRDYNTISIGMLDDYFATIALESMDKILTRSHNITRKNREILDNWVTSEPSISYIKPKSGTTALLKYHFDMPSWDFCVQLIKATGVMLCPGSVMGIEGYLRIGYANNTDVLTKGLALFSDFLRSLRS